MSRDSLSGRPPQALNLSEANVKVRLLRARLELREHLTRVLGDPSRVVKKESRHHHEH